MSVNALILSNIRTCIHSTRDIFSRNLLLKYDNDDEDDDN